MTLQVGTPRTRCVDSPKLGAAHLGPGSPIRTLGTVGAPAHFPNEDGPSSQTLSPYPVPAALGENLFHLEDRPR